MIRHSICILCLTTTLAAGCRTQPYVNAHIETVNAEFREFAGTTLTDYRRELHPMSDRFHGAIADDATGEDGAAAAR